MEARWSTLTWVLLALLILTWGFNYLFVAVGLTAAGPIWLAIFRSGFGFLGTLVLVTLARAWGTLDAAARRDALLLGLPNTTLFFGLWFVAARSVPPGIASVVIYTFPLWVALLSAPVLGRPLGRVAWLAIATGFVGVALVSEAWTHVGPGLSIAPILELLAAASSWAVGTVLFQRRFNAPQMLSASAYQLAGGTLGLCGALLLTGVEPLPRVTLDFVAAVLWLGILGTAVGYAIWFTLLGRTPAARLSAYLFFVPVVALTASILLLGERLVWVQAAGVGLVILAIYGIGRARLGAPAETVVPVVVPPSE
jgi:drug/metabolite transporter (DMT)-like permease